jgi:hypothetical protein
MRRECRIHDQPVKKLGVHGRQFADACTRSLVCLCAFFQKISSEEHISEYVLLGGPEISGNCDGQAEVASKDKRAPL